MNFSPSKIASRISRILVPLSFVALAGSVFAQPASTAASTKTNTTYPAGSIQSMEAADAALAAVVKERKDVEARYAAEEKACHPQFLATSCIDKAQERRYQAMSQLRKVEVEANAFKRQSRVTQRDKALSEHLSKEEAKQQERAKRLQPSDSADDEPAENAPEPAAPSRTKTRIFTDRAAQHEAKMKQIREEEAASVQERADNVAAYERKVQDAQLRQQKVAERKAEKEKKRKKKEELPPESGTKPE